MNTFSGSKRIPPIVALVNKPDTRYYGVDPRGLAQVVLGVAHVPSLLPEAGAKFAQGLGGKLGPVAGAARIYVSGFTATASSNENPLIRDPSAHSTQRGDGPSAFRRLLCRRGLCDQRLVNERVRRAATSALVMLPLAYAAGSIFSWCATAPRLQYAAARMAWRSWLFSSTRICRTVAASPASPAHHA